MSNPHLPRETLDHIIDLLCDEPETLKERCLVSKPWVPRARKHPFDVVFFLSVKALESWKKTFPVPSDSPSHHAHTLAVSCTLVVMESCARAGGLIQTFPRVVRLRLTALRAKNFGSGWCPSSPAPRILIHPQIAPHDWYHPSMPAAFQPDLLLPPS